VTRSLRLARRTTVADTQGILAIEPLLIREDTDLLEAMRFAAQHPSTRILGIVGARRVLVGILPVAELAEAVVAHAVPEAFFSGSGDIAEIGRFGHALEARSIGEIMQPPATITGERTIGDAFRQMHERRISGLYVVDGAGVPTGYLDLQELAMRYVEALEADQGRRHASVTDVQDPPTQRDDD
jgi:CBS domain-containing protein